MIHRWERVNAMQNRYVVDVTDFGKYGLLRHLSGMTAQDDLPPLSVGMIWYFHHDERHSGDRRKMSGDGNHTDYLIRTPEDDRAEYVESDPALWDKLRDLLLRDARCVHCVKASGILPKDTLWWDAPVPYLPGNSNDVKDAKENLRNLWLEGAAKTTTRADIVFLDPDNGLGEEKDKLKKAGTKYAYPSDVAAFWEQKKSVILFHQPGHEEVLPEYRVAEVLRRTTGREPIGLRLRHGSTPIFYVVAQDRHGPILLSRLTKFADKWKEHFREV